MVRKRKKKPFLLALDFGGSATKIIGGKNGSEREVTVMNPEVCEVPLMSLTNKNIAGIKGDRKNRAWIGFNGKYYAVGHFAKDYLVTPQLKPLKSNLAIPKILSACWIYSEQFKLGSEFDISTACFLPPGEYEDRAEFKKELQIALSEFETPDGIFKVALTHFECIPESVGIFMEHWRKRSEEAPNSLCANLMFGYRNASAVLIEKGNFGKWQTTNLGFIKMIESVQQKTSGYTIETLTQAIAQWDGKDDKCLKLILRKDKLESRTIELETLKYQIRIAKEEYMTRVRHWLAEIIPNEVEEIVISGGTADYFEKELEDWARTLIPVILFWHGGVTYPEDIQKLRMGNRMADIWMLWQYFCLEVHNFRKKTA